jgi:preprotein translocase subunit SecG
MQILINILLVIETIVALLIILLVLMQRPKNEGLGAAFGGGMTENLFGAQTTNVLQKLTRNLGIFFFALTMLLSWLYVKKMNVQSEVQRQLASAPTPPPVATPAPAAAPEAASAPVKVDEKSSATPAPKPASATPAPTPAKPATPAPAEEKPATPAPKPPQ